MRTILKTMVLACIGLVLLTLPVGAGDAVEIWVTPPGDDFELVRGFWDKAAKEIKEELGVDIVVTDASNGTARQEKLILTFGTENAPDIVPVEFRFIPHGFYADLGPLIERDAYDTAIFSPAATDLFHIGGRQLGLPQRINPYVMYYNADRLAQSGVPAPSAQWADPDWTWDALAEAAPRVSRVDSAGEIERTALGSDNLGFFWSLPWSYGGDWFDSEYNPTLYDPAVKRMVDYYSDLVSSGYLNNWNFRDFIDNKVAYVVQHLGVSAILQNGIQGQFDWNMAPVPMGTRTATNMGVTALGIISTSPRKDDAWKVLKWMLSREIQEELVVGIMKFLPGRRDAADAILSLAGTTLPVKMNMVVAAQAPMYGRVSGLTMLPTWNEIAPLIRNGLSDVVLERKSDYNTWAASIEAKYAQLLHEGAAQLSSE